MSNFGHWLRRKRYATAGHVGMLESRLAAMSDLIESGLRTNALRTDEALNALAQLRQATAEHQSSTDASNEAIPVATTAIAALETKLTGMLVELYAGEVEDRRRLASVRAEADYELAYSEDRPLVTILIPTYTNWEMLRSRAIPSVLAQTYEEIEVLVVGDKAPNETKEVIEEFADERLRYINLPTRGHYPEDDQSLWLVSGVEPYNAGLQVARGRWISPFADDDALRPDAIESSLTEARRARLEVCYGLMDMHRRTGEHEILGQFPPRLGNVGLQGCVYHAHLRIFEQLLGGPAFGLPNDWLMLRRMLNAGAHVGFLDQVVSDYHPSYRAFPDLDR